MSDFTSDFWHFYVAGLTLISILACLVLLWISGTTTVMSTEDNSTGHAWDGVKEMNNPLPRWWVYLFVITVVFALVYGVLYPMFGKFPGVLGWTSSGQYVAEKTAAKETAAPIFARFEGMTPEQLIADPQAMAVGERLFMNTCAQCHGSDARGFKGFPDLTDNDWLWGGEHAAIKLSIAQGRASVMPPLGAALGSADDVRNLAHYVLSLSGSPHDAVRAAQGRGNFASCAACHGAEGKGNTALGAPNLTDGIWLHGWGEAAIVRSINDGITNQMPGQSARLNEEQIHVLSAYVLGLSGKAGN